jgi:hypothetical protein
MRMAGRKDTSTASPLGVTLDKLSSAGRGKGRMVAVGVAPAALAARTRIAVRNSFGVSMLGPV